MMVATVGTCRPVIPADGLTVHEEQAEAARRTVCANARTAAEAAEFMAMLGISPDASEACSRPSVPLSKNEHAALHAKPRTRTVRTGDPCAGGCGRAMRAQHATTALAPGTVAVAARGMCSGCYRKARADEAAAP
ncbi:hypothetical protein [Tomitella cavernea]|nr:hypothetical protein [Tomitella cavernea]